MKLKVFAATTAAALTQLTLMAPAAMAVDTIQIDDPVISAAIATDLGLDPETHSAFTPEQLQNVHTLTSYIPGDSETPITEREPVAVNLSQVSLLTNLTALRLNNVEVSHLDAVAELDSLTEFSIEGIPVEYGDSWDERTPASDINPDHLKAVLQLPNLDRAIIHNHNLSKGTFTNLTSSSLHFLEVKDAPTLTTVLPLLQTSNMPNMHDMIVYDANASVYLPGKEIYETLISDDFATRMPNFNSFGLAASHYAHLGTFTVGDRLPWTAVNPDNDFALESTQELPSYMKWHADTQEVEFVEPHTFDPFNGTEHTILQTGMHPNSQTSWAYQPVGIGADVKLPAPETPTLEVTDSTENTVTVTWETPDTNGNGNIDEYTIQYREKGSDEWISVVVPGDQNMFTVPGLTPGTEYDFSISYVTDQNVTSNTSDIVTGKTLTGEEPPVIEPPTVTEPPVDDGDVLGTGTGGNDQNNHAPGVKNGTGKVDNLAQTGEPSSAPALLLSGGLLALGAIMLVVVSLARKTS